MSRFLDAGSVAGSVGAVITSTAASICCIGPAGIALLGVEGAILAAGLKPYRAYLLGGSLLLIGLAFWRVYGRARAGPACPVRAGRFVRASVWGALVLWLGAVALQFAADRYWL